MLEIPFLWLNGAVLMRFSSSLSSISLTGSLLATLGCLGGGTAVFAQDLPPPRMSLDSVLERVIATDRTVAVADLEVRKSVIERLRAASRLAPRLSMDANSNWQGNQTRNFSDVSRSTNGPQTLTGNTGPLPAVVPTLTRERRWTRSHSNGQTLGLNLSQPLIDLTVGPAKQQAEYLIQISQCQLRQRLREVLFAVTAEYFEILRQSELVTENTKTLGQTSELVRQAEGRFKAQEVIASDVLQAQVSDEQARRAVMEAEVSRDLAKARLAVTLDYLPLTEFSLEQTPTGKPAAKSIREAITAAHQKREEIRLAELTKNRTLAERAEIRARFAPTVDLQLGGDLGTGSTLDRRDSWSAGVSFSWSIFERGQRMLDLKTNGLRVAEDDLRVEDSLKAVSNDVVDAWYTMERASKRLQSLAIERKAAEANYDVQQGKYKAGLATALEVQTALRDLARVRIEHVSTTFDLEIAYRDLENVLALYEGPRINAATLRMTQKPQSTSTNLFTAP